MPHFPLKLRLLSVLCLCGAPALAEDVAWQARPEPMGAKAQEVMAAARKNPTGQDAALLLAKAMRLPQNQCVAVLEACLREEAVSAAMKDAVLNLLAEDPACPVSRRLADALLLSAPQGGARPERWQKSLRRFHTAEVVGVLGAWSRDRSLPFERRAAALGALGYLPSCASLDLLLSMRESKQEGDWALRGQANAALREMFCLTADPTPEQLTEWRALAGRRDQTAFNLYLKDRLEAALRAGRAEAYRYIGRIVKQEESLFARETSKEQDAHLEKLLADPELAEVRLLALELVDGQVALGRPVSDPVCAAIRACLTYSMPQVRSKSVHLLRVLGDIQGAKLVAGRLVRSEEDSGEVLEASMRLMQREPQDDALPAVLQLLDHPSANVAAAATEALGAYAEKNKLDASVRRTLAGTLLARLGAKQAVPGVSQVLLLGAVLEPEDKAGWERIAGWLANAHVPATTREAAALALEKSTQPLAPLLACVGGADAKLAEIALRAVRERGRTQGDVAVLLEHVPAPGAARDLWADALLGWAGRALPMDVDGAALAAVKNGAPGSLAVRMLGKVLGRSKTVTDAERAILLTHRGEALEASGDLAGALEDYDGAFPFVQAGARPGAFTKRMQLRLSQGKVADAAALWAKAAADGMDPAVIGSSLEPLLAAIDQEGAKTGGALDALGKLKQAVAGKPAASLLPQVEKLILKWTPPAPVKEPAKEPVKEGAKDAPAPAPPKVP